MKEKRRYYRLDTDLKASVRREGITDFSPAKIVNISVVGVYLKPKKPLSSGKQIELCFHLPGASRNKIICQARVAWTAEFKGYHSGVKFVDIKRVDKYRIAGFIRDSLRKRNLEK